MSDLHDLVKHNLSVGTQRTLSNPLTLRPKEPKNKTDERKENLHPLNISARLACLLRARDIFFVPKKPGVLLIR
jgi:hypothetical protein